MYLLFKRSSHCWYLRNLWFLFPMLIVGNRLFDSGLDRNQRSWFRFFRAVLDSSWTMAVTRMRLEGINHLNIIYYRYNIYICIFPLFKISWISVVTVESASIRAISSSNALQISIRFVGDLCRTLHSKSHVIISTGKRRFFLRFLDNNMQRRLELRWQSEENCIVNIWASILTCSRVSHIRKQPNGNKNYGNLRQ